MQANRDNDRLIFDAWLVSAEHAGRIATFEAAGITHRGRLSYPAFWLVGTIGMLSLHDDEESFLFQSYPDQRLRRAAQRDPPDPEEWAWTIENQTFIVRRGIVPGFSGVVVRDDCLPLALQVPPEFLAFCGGLKVEPARVLRAFIADACAILDSRRRPREDGYCSSGAHERFLAREYCRRAFHWPHTTGGPTDPNGSERGGSNE